MQKVILSNPTDFEGEIAIIEQLLMEESLIFHLRKPDKTLKQLEDFLRSIPAKFYKKIVLHSHHELIKKYNLKGIHITESVRQNMDETVMSNMIKLFRNRGLSVSFSLHTLNAIENLAFKADYVFLSPILKSISKTDYIGTFTMDELRFFFQVRKSEIPVFALGGICEENKELLERIGFQGFVMMGSVWEKYFLEEKQHE
ncbi:thiamine phosphate synthase [Arcicella rosea]|uniref:Thiamine-phosphate pyrophosphorylase n=1 Tax=Arcicella rosea TaxID=502909 RepID=A0A841EVG2_9BACT|nr:thiamine phosphate synthase [Arcicella rosea]MBB6005053.1 thiamine-phosphate pyrophosphorylase [Arcicella rosea]